MWECLGRGDGGGIVRCAVRGEGTVFTLLGEGGNKRKETGTEKGQTDSRKERMKMETRNGQKTRLAITWREGDVH